METTDKARQHLKKLGDVIYYLYEIVGVKIGVTYDLTQRQKAQKNKGKLVILGEYKDIYEVSEIERELQAEKGYHVDKHPYWYTVLVQLPKALNKENIAKRVATNDFRAAADGTTRKFTKEQVIKLRKKYEKNKHISAADLATKEGVSVQTMITLLNGTKYSEIPGAVEIRNKTTSKCKYCGLEASVSNIKRWHNKNCNQAPNPIHRQSKGKTKYKELTTGEVKYLFEFALQYKVAPESIISNTKFPKPGKCGPLKGLNFVRL